MLIDSSGRALVVQVSVTIRYRLQIIIGRDTEVLV